jgi:hypothetical protein
LAYSISFRSKRDQFASNVLGYAKLGLDTKDGKAEGLPPGVAEEITEHRRQQHSPLRAAERGCDFRILYLGRADARRALCEGLVIDLSGMNGAIVDSIKRTARVAGGPECPPLYPPLRVMQISASDKTVTILSLRIVVRGE